MGKKILLFAVFLVFIISNVSAINLDIKKIDKGSVIVSELDNPAVFDFVINNKGLNDTFEIYSLVSVSMAPKGTFELLTGETEIKVWAWPSKEMREDLGFLSFEYQIKGKHSGILKDNLIVKIVSFKDVLEISSESFHPDDDFVTLIIKNKENTRFDNVGLELESIFFSDMKTISLGPYEETKVQVKINKDVEGVGAGAYIVFATLQGRGEGQRVEGVLDYLEKSEIFFEESSSGFFVKKKTLKKTNVGNIPTTVQVEIREDIVSRLFTLNSEAALDVSREGFYVVYSWNRYLRPGESLAIQSTTNYTFPFVLGVLIVLVGFSVFFYSRKSLILTKRVSYVRTKHGEFALKVNLRVKARKHVNNVKIIDSLPGMAKLYDGFGRKPDRVDKTTRRMFWNVEKLSAGEVRVYSYVLYSKFNVVGRFEVPAATAVFVRDGKSIGVRSNKAYFAKEERG